MQQPKVKTGLLLVESVGNSLGGVLSGSVTFSSALADALKGCVHPVAICREVRTRLNFFPTFIMIVRTTTSLEGCVIFYSNF